MRKRESWELGNPEVMPTVVRILYLEDNQIDAELVAHELEKANFDFALDIVVDEREFRHALDSKDYDVILSDYSVPQWTGLEAFHAVSEKDSEVPFILVTGTLGEEIAVGYIKAGITDCIFKDHLARLPASVEQAIRERDVNAKLRFHEALLMQLMDNIPDYIYFKDLQSRFIRISQAHAARFGLKDPTEAIGRTDFDFFSELHARGGFEDEQAVIRTEEPIINKEEREIRPDGSEAWVLTTKMPFRGVDGKLFGTFGISRDITALKQTEEHILSLARFPDEDPHPVMRVQSDGMVLYANDASEILLSSDEDGNRRAPQGCLDALGSTWESGERREIEIVVDSRFFAVTVVPFSDSGYINLYAREVTEERILGERLNQSQRMEAIGRLTGGVAHDFNNVLQAIMGYSEVLRLKSPAENQRYISEIITAAKRAAALTSQLLAFSRKQVLRPQVVETKTLIRSMQGMLDRIIGDDVELQTVVEPDAGNFVADPGQMEQVLLNLAVNARDAMPSGGKIIIRAANRTLEEGYGHQNLEAKAGTYVGISVSDSGTGMDAETLRHIYEPFFTTKEKGKGTGLGLATVYGIVRQSDGYIDCRSDRGIGTTFTIYLPLTIEVADEGVDAQSKAAATGGTETLLLVDDDNATRNVTQLALEEAGYTVIAAPDGEEAIQAALSQRAVIHLLVSDVVMGHMSGKELAGRLHTAGITDRVLYVSGYPTDVISKHGILEPEIDLLQKPFGTRELLSTVRKILDRP